MQNNKIRVRIAPSPTGDPHIGTAYMALFNYAFAKKNHGEFIIRIEDTDQNRFKKTSEQDIMDSLKWLGLTWAEGPDIGGDYGPYRQSERLDIYKKYAEQLKNANKAYICVCSSERLDELRKKQQLLKQPTRYDGRCRNLSPEELDNALKSNTKHVLRLKTPTQGDIEMFDLLRGKITIAASEIDDQVLVKSDGFPTYHLASVIDDHEMAITHVIRGEEWISSLPKHVLLFEALGFELPTYCHLPLLRNADKSKVSKRKNPVSIKYFRQAGFLPQTMLNFLGLMAYSLPNGEEIFSLEDFVKDFDLQRISLGGPVFDVKKLTWLNGKYLREKLTNPEIVDYLQKQLFSKDYLEKIVALVKERMDKSEDFIENADFFFSGLVNPELNNCLITGHTHEACAILVEEILESLENLEDFSSENVNNLLKEFCAKHSLKPKDVFMPLRLMICGKSASPPLFETMAVLGKERIRTRLRCAIEKFKQFKGN